MEDQTKEAQPSLMLKTYLNDHLAGSTGGRDLLRRAAKTHSSDPLGPELAELAEEVSQDRESLRRIMRTLRVPQQPAKIALGWAAEKLDGSSRTGASSTARRSATCWSWKRCAWGSRARRRAGARCAR